MKRTETEQGHQIDIYPENSLKNKRRPLIIRSSLSGLQSKPFEFFNRFEFNRKAFHSESVCLTIIITWTDQLATDPTERNQENHIFPQVF